MTRKTFAIVYLSTILLFICICATPNPVAAQICGCEVPGSVEADPSILILIPAQPVCSQPVCSTGGPGTEMTKIINRMGLGSDCGRCKALAAQMDRGGPEWVRQNFDYVVDQTIRNAENLGHRMGPVRRMGVRFIVRRSIRSSR